ncbi:peptidase S8/S53 domain-containing protein [Multifurca ochricompacta]|uniref:tripeptidyl-peptidase II n=1 Tax=Multifurca ochricompacta TaxID=376703 RepID=A0AAD4QRJ8_9AGAM|nr:peptidase S8/S53 domain-containing protein [Multifurca ochricompacta]
MPSRCIVSALPPQGDGRNRDADDWYSLPAILHEHVQTVAPTTYFGFPRPLRRTSRVRPNGPTLPEGDLEFQKALAKVVRLLTTITPSCLRALYNTATYFANHADLTTFMSRFRSDATSAAFTVVQVNGGGNDQTNPGVEANLDIQYGEAISFPTPNIYYSTGGSPPFIPDSFTPTNTNEPYLDWLNFLLAQTTIPQTISTSYDYATSVCNLFAQLGTMGSTVLFSSGDSGVGGGSCTTNDGTNRVQFIPNFPASCMPFVTTVGGTTRVSPEVAASFSGGGFSNYFARPATRTPSIGTKNAGLFNTAGRAYPDISAQAENFQIIVGGSVTGVDGTSCSSPTAAGVISLLNDFLIAQGKPSLGFLNPLIYGAGATGFNDIVSGSNPGCGTSGFSAVSGWDPVTGLGTPDFAKLQTIVG